MPKAKKKFIDRKKAVTFNLVHRSQRDPLVADETAPQRVLVPVNANIPNTRKEKDPELSTEQRKEEQRKYGIYFDDDYNYLQHLKDTKEVTMVLQPKASHKRKEKQINTTNVAEDEEDDETDVTDNIKLPSSVFASAVEEDVGLLNKAASQGLCLDLDPEVVAALDEDFDFDDPENQLEDNFIELAMGEEGSDESDEEGSMSADDDSDKAFASDLDSDDDSDRSQERRPKMPSWGDKDDTKSRFSQYSMSSSVIRRNEGLSLLDNRFEKMFEEYDDTEVGALDLEEIEGFMPETHDMLLRAAKEFEDSQKRYKLDKEKEIARMQRLQEIEEDSEEDDLITMEVEPKEKWDCETILSTYSNLYNHPKIIEEPKKPKKIKINTKTGIPEDTLGKDNKLTMKSLAKFNAMNNDTKDMSDEDGRTNAETVLSTLSVLSIRPKEETPEEKKERKRLLKEYRKERRIEKKANKEAFKEEKKRQEKIMLNNRNNVQGNRIL
ncbi:unnamed protein product [Euphydryas editha]|uniref:Protein LTV1 homolog n=1 Tax=Euphydryas editha TaxID=104508 RepID=A0AAU9UEN2_EUPED|nr:unnamed protein product [Euphydryas editha]